MSDIKSRRELLKVVGKSLAVIPLCTGKVEALAVTNQGGRAKFNYQDFPKGEWSCATCLDFLPSASNPSRGGCKKIPLDDEILADGYCIAWNTM